MKTYRGGELANSGVYMNLSNWELTQVHLDSPALPGPGEAKYVRMPAPLAVIAGPVAGLAFVIFLPLVGIVGMVYLLIYRAQRALAALTHRAVPTTPVAVKEKHGPGAN